MGNFNRDRNNRDQGRRSNDRSFNRRDSGRSFNRGGANFGRPDMHQAICDDCGQNCEVPFKPTGDKPIYCSSCFEKKGRGTSRSDKFDSGRGSRQSFSDRGPSSASVPNQDSKEILKSIKTLNYKLDELIRILGPKALAEKIAGPQAKEKAPEKIEPASVKPDKVVVKKTITKKKTASAKKAPKAIKAKK